MLLCPRNCPGKNTAMGCHFFLQRIFPTRDWIYVFYISCIGRQVLFFFFFRSTSLLLPTHLPPPSCTHAQSCNPMNFNPPDSSVHGFFQARILEWVAISFSRQAGSLPLAPPGMIGYGLFTKWSNMNLLKKNIASRNFYQVTVIKFCYKKEAKWTTEMA